ncbi:hypothetical protein BC567DRAFT_260295 [Phyllosticta citribraziliensis]
MGPQNTCPEKTAGPTGSPVEKGKVSTKGLPEATQRRRHHDLRRANYHDAVAAIHDKAQRELRVTAAAYKKEKQEALKSGVPMKPLPAPKYSPRLAQMASGLIDIGNPGARGRVTARIKSLARDVAEAFVNSRYGSLERQLNYKGFPILAEEARKMRKWFLSEEWRRPVPLGTREEMIDDLRSGIEALKLIERLIQRS